MLSGQVFRCVRQIGGKAQEVGKARRGGFHQFNAELQGLPDWQLHRLVRHNHFPIKMASNGSCHGRSSLLPAQGERGLFWVNPDCTRVSARTKTSTSAAAPVAR